jgi:hypothetical protein
LLENNTIVQNHCTEGPGGGIYTNDEGYCRGANNILFDNTGVYGAQWYGNLDLTYSCSSDSLPGIGNIAADPLFVDPTQQDFHLQADSPCIDSGDPASPLDPDSTRADIGALYFDQGIQPFMQIVLTPVSTPILIPPEGGRFSYDARITNNNLSPQTADVWVSVTLPGGTQLSPLLGPVCLSLPAQSVISRNRTQDVPGNAPAGIYCYRACLGTFPEIVADSDSFLFEKVGDGAGAEIGSWTNRGAEFTADEGIFASHAAVFPVKVFPNPFNRSGVVTFHLPEAALVELSVFDPAGRREVTVYSGRLHAGEQHLFLDGAKLTSGVHLYRLRAGDRIAWGKLVVLK